MASGVCKYTKQVTVEVSTRKSIWKDNQSTIGTANVTVEGQFTERDLPERSIAGELKLVHGGTVKHVVYQSCRSSSVPGPIQ